MQQWDDVIEVIRQQSDQNFELEAVQSVGGGCINQAWQITGVDSTQGEPKSYFVKSNNATGLGMFEAEYDGLHEIAATHTVRVPTPIATGTTGGSAWFVMEYIELSGTGGASQLGTELAQMHKCCNAQFGWTRDNTIGSTPQPNNQGGHWQEFWGEQRLGFQLTTAANNGYGGRLQKLGEQLRSRLDIFFSDYSPEASLLHGDLWGGNWSCASSGEPVIYDPASYYGDRETDIAMTELFGGFSQDFYQAYQQEWPLHEGYSIRKTLYNLYHILNHLNLFGGGYASQAETMMQSLLADT